MRTPGKRVCPKGTESSNLSSSAALGKDALTHMLIHLAMTDADVCYQNCGVPIHGNIAGARPVDYTESDEIHKDFHRLAVPGDSFPDEVQAMRDEVESDLSGRSGRSL